MPGWSAHRLEELTNANKIIRPAYKYVGHHTEFETMEERSAEKITDEDVKEEAEKCKKEEKGKNKKQYRYRSMEYGREAGKEQNRQTV